MSKSKPPKKPPVNDDGQKKPRQIISYTPEQIVELKRCSEDIFHFIEEYVKIVDPVKGNVPFKLFDYQRELIAGFLNNRNTVVMAARQTGKCLQEKMNITIKNKKTGYIYELPIGVFYQWEFARVNNQPLPDISVYRTQKK